MPSVRFTPHLRRFFPLPDEVSCEGRTVAEVIEALDRRWPGLAFYLVDERGTKRQHVAIWVDGTLLHDDDGLDTPVGDENRVTILQALSGG